MSDPISPVERADRLSRSRARMLPVLAILLITQPGAFLSDAGQAAAVQAVDVVKLSAWVVMAAVILLFLVTGGGWIQSREVRALLNDESTRANRTAALVAGFVVAMATAIVCYVVAVYEPTPARTAIHVIVTTGLAAALFRFAALERRAHRAG